ncbi:MAG: FlgD immunoglobulin-like domain containing protein, partial [bacterium]|nr:FlgD immunoglobulin-like domain containing protein [bacterium]
AILMGGTPSSFGGGGYSCSNIADWFGTGQYSNVGVSDARVAIDYPLGTSLVSNDVIEHCGGWGGAGVKNVAADAMVLAMWDYGSGNIHSFIRSHQNGRVAFWAGNASYNSKNQELFKAICDWAVNATTFIENEKSTKLPEGYHLFQNYPNPFNPTTTISYALPEAAHVQIQVFDLNGRMVRTLADTEQQTGIHLITWDARDKAGNEVANGMYICRMIAGGVILHQKLILAK